MEYRFLNQSGALSTVHGEEMSESDVASSLLKDWSPRSTRKTNERDWAKIDLQTFAIPRSILANVPESVARENVVLPLADDGTVHEGSGGAWHAGRAMRNRTGKGGRIIWRHT